MKIRNFKYNYFVLGTVAVTTFALVGCATGPYVSADIPRPGMSTTDVKSILAGEPDAFETGSSNLKTTSVSFGAAAQYGRFLQDAYNKALVDRSKLRRASNLSTIWLGISALGMEATDNGGDTALISGLVASALGISSRSLLTRNHEAAYSLGARQIACVLTSATNKRPTTYNDVLVRTELVALRKAVAEYDTARSEAIRTSESKINASFDNYLTKTDLEIERFERDIQTLQGGISDLEKGIRSGNKKEIVSRAGIEIVQLVSRTQSDNDADLNKIQSNNAKLEIKRESLRDKKGEQSNFLNYRARIKSDIQTYKDSSADIIVATESMIAVGGAFLEDYNRLGEQLLNKIEEIRWEVNDAVRRSEPDLIQLNSNLRSVVNNQLSFSNMSLTALPEPSFADTPNVQALKSGNGSLRSMPSEVAGVWENLTDEGDKIKLRVMALSKTIQTLSSKAMLTFPDDTFAACSNAGLQSITGPAPVSLSPANITLKSDYSGGGLLTAISGGTAPYGSPSKTNVKVTFVNNVATIVIGGDAAEAGNSPIQIVISDMFGKSAILTITPPDKAPSAPANPLTAGGTAALAPGAIVNDGTVAASESQVAKKEAVTKVQQEIEKLTLASGVSWLDDLVARSVFPDLNTQVDENKGFVDGDFGKVTRQVVQHYIKENWTGNLEDTLTRDAPNPPTLCSMSADALKPKIVLTPDGTLFSPDQLKATSETTIDSALIDFILGCDIIK